MPNGQQNFAYCQETGTTLAVIGSGYVGLTAAVCFALLGHRVICSDVSTERVRALRRGECPIVEEGLPELLHTVLDRGLLTFSADNGDAVGDADFVFLCLPTPEGADGQADLSFVCRAAAGIGPRLRPGTIVINKSTVPVGTAELVAAEIDRPDVEVASNPEFLAEGTALHDFLHPDRIVVGASKADVAHRVAALYTAADAPVVITDLRSAETIKYASNAFLATKLAFVNSMAALCEIGGADIRSVTEGMGLDQRIGHRFLRPGPGWGGSCFPKDTHALVRTARDSGEPFSLLEAAVTANETHRARIVDKVARAMGGELRGSTIALWGLTFKAGTNDLRDSPARALAAELRRRGATVRGFDPTVDRAVDDVLLCHSPLEACEGACVLLVATEWPAFAEIDLATVRAVMSGSAIVDARNLLDAEAARANGFDYSGVGLGSADAARYTPALGSPGVAA